MSSTLSVVDHILNGARPISEALSGQGRTFMPADIDLSAPKQRGILDGATFQLPAAGSPAPSGAELLLSKTMDVPQMSVEPIAAVLIPDDYDLMADLPAPSSSPLGFLSGHAFSAPVMVKPESAAERVLRSSMQLPSIGFGEAVRRTQEDRTPVHDHGLSR